MNNSYFSEEIIEAVKEMSSDEMNSLLRGLDGSPQWIAILKYLWSRADNARNSLYTLDPFKDQVTMARSQGILMGLTDLQQMVVLLNEKSEENSETESEK